MPVNKRGKRWYYGFTIRGKRYREAIPEARNKAQAERAETQAREAVYHQRYGVAGDSIVFADFAADTYLPWAKANKKSWQQDQIRLAAILAVFGKQKLSAITPAQIETYKQARIASQARYGSSKTVTRPRSAASVNHELAVMSRIFGLAIEQKLLEMNPVKEVRKLRMDNRRTRVCSLEEEIVLRAELPRVAGLMFTIAIQTGMRRGELVALNWPDVDFLRGQILIRTSKSGKPRTIPMSANVRQLLAELLKERTGSPAVFLNRAGERYGNPDCVFRDACKRRGIADLRWHDLRHTAATRMADSGVDPFVMAEILGHSDINMTRRYTHATDQRRQAAVELLARYGDEDGHKSVTGDKLTAAG